MFGSNKFSILKPTKTSPPQQVDIVWLNTPPHHRQDKDKHLSRVTSKSLRGLLKGIESSPYVALDWETDGTFVPSALPSSPKHCIPVGLAVSWLDEKHLVRAAYFVLNGLGKAKRASLLKALFKATDGVFMAHNLAFDGAIILRELGYWPDALRVCTYAMTKHLAGEGFEGQRWGLKYFMTELLGWPDKNDTAIDGWLIRQGYYSSSTAQTAYRLRTRPDGSAVMVAARKEEMYRCPPWILGQYAALDAAATLQLYHHVLKPAIDSVGGPSHLAGSYLWFWNIFLTTIKECSQSYLHGLPVNVPELSSYYCDSSLELKELEYRLRHHPKIKDALILWNSRILKQKLEKAPERLTKDGLPSKVWSNWLESYSEMMATDHFNFDSPQHLSWLLYEYLQEPVKFRTATGEPSTGNQALAQVGEIGQLLLHRKAIMKRVSAFLHPYIYEHLHKGRIHPRYKVPQAVTGRLSSSDPNVQQISKDKRLLDIFVPSKGKILVDADFAAIENIVLAELSGDENMMRLYGGDSVNDPHLFTAAGIRAFADKIRAAGYDPLNPTPEGIANAKKLCKKERAAAKKVNYSIIYGIGARKLSADLTAEGIPTSEEEASEMIQSWWNTYSGVKALKEELLKEHAQRGGWFRNGLGLPVAVAPDKTKDLLSRLVQGTAHSLLTIYIDMLVKYRDNECDFAFRLYIPDWHDQTMCEVDPANAEALKEIMETIIPARLNELLQPKIPIKMEATICNTVGDSKF